MSLKHNPKSKLGRGPGLLSSVLLALVCACAGRGGSSEHPDGDEFNASRRAAELEAELREDPEAVAAQRELALLYWGPLADRERASEYLKSASASSDPTALWLNVVQADLSLDAERVWKNGRALLEGLVAARADGDGRRSKRKQRKAQRQFSWLAEEVADDMVAVSLRALARVLDRRPSLYPEFNAWYDQLDRSHLPPSTRQELSALRVLTSRRAGESPKALFQAQGCVQAWTASPTMGEFGVLELQDSLRGGVDQLKPDAKPKAEALPPVALDCAMRLWNERPDAAPGVRHLATDLELKGEVLRLHVRARGPIRLRVNGHDQLVENGVERQVPRVRELKLALGAGRHRVEIWKPVSGRSSWISMRATEADGTPVVASAASGPAPKSGAKPAQVASEEFCSIAETSDLAGPGYRELREYCMLDNLLDRADYDRSVELMLQMEAQDRLLSAESNWLRARTIDVDPALPQELGQAELSRIIGHVQTAEATALRPWIRSVRLKLDRDELDEAAALIAKGAPGGQETVETLLEAFRVHWRQGAEIDALKVLDAAEALQAKDCGLWRARRQVALEQGGVAPLDRAMAELRHCEGGIALAAAHAIGRGHFDEARSFLEEQRGRVPDDVDTLAALGSLAIARGQHETAEEALAELLRLGPTQAEVYLALADLALDAGERDTAKRWLETGIKALPATVELRRALARLGGADDLMAQRVVGPDLLREFRENGGGSAYPGEAAVYILDSDVARLYADGTQRHLVHQLILMQTREALDHFGEVELPGSAEVLTLRTIKPDGRVVDPEWIADKSGWSLRELEVGDVYEVEYLLPVAPALAPAGLVDVGAFRFQSVEAPFHRSELRVLYPEGMNVAYEARANAPAPIRRTRGSLQELHFLDERKDRLVPEPYTPDESELVPNVQVYVPMEHETWLRGFELRLFGRQRSDARIRAKVAELVAEADAKASPKSQPYERLKTIWSWVLAEVEDGGGLEGRVSHTFAQRRGNRTMLIHTMLREAGIRSEVWLLRNRFAPDLREGGYPFIDTFDSPLLAVWLEGNETPITVTSGSRVVPLGYLVPTHRASQGMRLHLWPDDPAPGEVQGPVINIPDSRHYQLRLVLDEGGRASVQGRLELTGFEAIQWRNALESIEAERLQEVFERVELPLILPGLELELAELDMLHLKELDEPLSFRFSAQLRASELFEDGQVRLRRGLVEANVGEQFSRGRAQRRWPLVVPYAPEVSVDAEIELIGTVVSEAPAAIEIKTPVGSYLSRTKMLTPQRMQLRSTSQVHAGRVEVGEYPELVDFIAKVRAAQSQWLAFE